MGQCQGEASGEYNKAEAIVRWDWIWTKVLAAVYGGDSITWAFWRIMGNNEKGRVRGDSWYSLAFGDAAINKSMDNRRKQGIMSFCF